MLRRRLFVAGWPRWRRGWPMRLIRALGPPPWPYTMPAAETVNGKSRWLELCAAGLVQLR
jgi:hypothetical protein